MVIYTDFSHEVNNNIIIYGIRKMSIADTAMIFLEFFSKNLLERSSRYSFSFVVDDFILSGKKSILLFVFTHYIQCL